MRILEISVSVPRYYHIGVFGAEPTYRLFENLLLRPDKIYAPRVLGGVEVSEKIGGHTRHIEAQPRDPPIPQKVDEPAHGHAVSPHDMVREIVDARIHSAPHSERSRRVRIGGVRDFTHKLSIIHIINEFRYLNDRIAGADRRADSASGGYYFSIPYIARSLSASFRIS